MTPELLAAIQTGEGVAHLHDPASGRVFLLVEQCHLSELSDEYFRAKIRKGITESERGESQPWNASDLKSELRQRHAARQSTD